jgi:hypothetical protein
LDTKFVLKLKNVLKYYQHSTCVNDMQHGIHDNQILSNIYSIIFNKFNFGIIRY